MESKKAIAKQLVKEYYKSNDSIPTTRGKFKWKPENKCGFLLGIIEFGLESHVSKLLTLLERGQFKVQEKAIVDEMYQFYIYPFKQHNGAGNSCHTPESSRPSSRNNSAEDLDYVPDEEERELNHKDLKKAVVKRDGVCLFCWNSRQLHGAHILAQKDIPFKYDETALFERTGLEQKHQVQNGLLLCAICHGEFDALKRYVDVVNDKLVVKVVNETDDPENAKYIEWKRALRDLKMSRQVREEDWFDIDSRQAINSDGELELDFLNNIPSLLPNLKALEFHKAACLIWRMAGGAEPDEEYCSDEDEPVNFVPTDFNATKVRKWLDDSNATLNTMIS